MLVLELLGTLSLRSDGRPVPVPAQQKRPLGLLAVLALGGRHGVCRERIEAYLWPESAGASARHNLDQTVYASRHALGSDVILSAGRELRLNPDLVRVDVWEFEDAIRGGQWAAAVDRYKGALLDGAHFADSRELESWIDTERARLLAALQGAVERLADIADEADDHAQSVTWCRKLAGTDPLSARATKRLMHALGAAGDRAGAVRHARLHQELVRQQLEMEPDFEIEDLAATLSRPATTHTAGAAARRSAPTVAPSPTSEASALPSGGGSLIGAGLRNLTVRHSLRMRRSRIAAVALVAVLTVMLIGAATVESRRRSVPRLRVPSAGESTTRRRSTSPVPAARHAYLRALDAWSDGSKTGLDSAVVYFRRAVELDQQYAEAYAGLADAFVMLGYFGYRPGDAVFPGAKDAALRSVRLDSTLASPHLALAYELTWERDFARADSEFRKAVALEPSHASARTSAMDPADAASRQWYPVLLTILGQTPEVVEANPRPPNRSLFSVHVPVVELTFTKWFSAYPVMAGFTSNGPGTFSGEVLSRIDDGAETHLVARYDVTDPSGSHAFKTVVQGKADDVTGRYNLNGVVAWGWMTGAHVHASFQRITPCKYGKMNVCFQGTIRIQRG
jgi:DNA-binding SARP family transcriptional activator